MKPHGRTKNRRSQLSPKSLTYSKILVSSITMYIYIYICVCTWQSIGISPLLTVVKPHAQTSARVLLRLPPRLEVGSGVTCVEPHRGLGAFDTMENTMCIYIYIYTLSIWWFGTYFSEGLKTPISYGYTYTYHYICIQYSDYKHLWPYSRVYHQCMAIK